MNDRKTLPFSTLGGFKLSARIGEGAAGAVYEARSTDAPEAPPVAIKVMHSFLASDPVNGQRFDREFEVTAGLKHPHIIRVFERGETPAGVPFLVMERLYGRELSLELAQRRRLGLAATIQIVARVASALDFAHAQGLIHRDLKPANIFLCPAGEEYDLRVLDFGSVKMQLEMGPKLTGVGTTLGSPAYMSPEQARGRQDIDGRSDIFSLAAVAYEALSGRVAFDGESVGEILMKVLREQPAALALGPSGVTAAVDAVLQRGLAKEKSERYAKASDFALDFARACGLDSESLQDASLEKLSVAEIRQRLPHLSEASAAFDASRSWIDGPVEDAVVPPPLSGKVVLLGLGLVVVVAVLLAVLAFRAC